MNRSSHLFHTAISRARLFKARISLSVRLAMLVAIACIQTLGDRREASADERPPNIVMILVDDLGKEWVSCYGAETIETPNIDRLAREGMMFNNFYCMPQCTPTRLTFLTGQYPFRHGWVNHWDVPRWGGGCSYDPALNPSIGLVMKSAGYSTVAAGKWQIDDFRQEPDAMQQAGFDDYCMWTGFEAGNRPSGKRYWEPYIHTKEGSRTYSDAFGPDVYCDFLIEHMRQHRNQPMFVYFPMALTHGPLVETPASRNENTPTKKPLDKHRAMVRYTDTLTGRLVAAVEELGLANDTIFIWTTDNGTSKGFRNRRNGRLESGGKSLTTETGVCVPFIVWAPGRIEPGQATDALADTTDLLPTFAELAGTRPPADKTIDGVSFAALLSGKSNDSPRQWIMAMGGKNEARLTRDGVRNKYVFRDRVLRDRRFKLYIDVNGKPDRLIDIQNDPGETNNLITSNAADCQAALASLSRVADTFPRQDASPRYTPLPHRPWFLNPVD